MSTEKPRARRSQVVTTYGPGSLLAHGDQSFMVCGLDDWPAPEPADLVSEPRLAATLGVSELRQPPADADNDQPWQTASATLPAIRFPAMHTCPECKSLDHYWTLADRKSNDCLVCGRAAVIPSRFIVACPAGHITDFPYARWVHRGAAPTGGTHKLSMQTSGTSASLRSIVIECSCGAKRSLEGAFDRHELSAVTRCTGRRPWLVDADRDLDCKATVRTLQRGASNVWFSSVASALSIPPWSDRAARLVDRYWTVLSAADPEMLQALLPPLAKQLSDSPGALDELTRAAQARKRDEAALGAAVLSDEALREQEYEALLGGKLEENPGDEFVAVSEIPPAPVASHFDRVVRASRLREVRALKGFTRLEAAAPGGESASGALAPMARKRLNWLPAMEVRGEGVFLELSRDRLEQWERRPAVRGRVGHLNERYRDAFSKDGEPVREITPRLVLIHTFAHCLIEQFSLDAGYPAAALRERLYVSERMCGLLVYTATSDSAGSLGGLIAQSEDLRLIDLLRETIARAEWCSADPVCMESEFAGVDGLNLASCHACTLLPETSCEERNLLLDRALLVGRPDELSLGYFGDWLGGS